MQAKPGQPRQDLERFFTTLLEKFGPQGWWPAETRWEVICGAILTQNTNWRNVLLALHNLRQAGLLDGSPLAHAALAEIQTLVRPAGFYRQKARTLRDIAVWIEAAHAGSLDRLFALGPERARAGLLSLRGIGPETADAILLYAGGLPVFVADAYTRRILSRHGLIAGDADYDSARQFLHQHLPPDGAVYNEFHALLVEAAKQFCRRNEIRCEECPLARFLTMPKADSRQLRAKKGSRPSVISSATEVVGSRN